MSVTNDAHTEGQSAIERTLTADAPRPLALVGRSGSGKTSLLRAELDRHGVTPMSTTARALAERIVEAIRSDTYDSVRATLVNDSLPLVVEHLEDLRHAAHAGGVAAPAPCEKPAGLLHLPHHDRPSGK